MPAAEENNEMTSRELARDMQLMTQSIAQLSKDIGKLVESDIRRQEKDSRQQDFNNQMRDRVRDLEGWRKDIEISRAKESQGREMLMKYWPVLFVVGAFVAYKLTKGGTLATIFS